MWLLREEQNPRISVTKQAQVSFTVDASDKLLSFVSGNLERFSTQSCCVPKNNPGEN